MVYISGMDVFVWGLIVVVEILENSLYFVFKKVCYELFDVGFGVDFLVGKLGLEDLVNYVSKIGEFKQCSG